VCGARSYDDPAGTVHVLEGNNDSGGDSGACTGR
jgi:hypothetical protein